MRINLRAVVQCAVMAIVAWGFAPVAQGQLQITEIMFNPNDPVGGGSDLIYEWIEVRNIGGTDINLDGAYFDDMLSPSIPTNGQPSVLSGQSQNTIIPAGSVAIIYDAVRAGGAGDDPNFDDSKFRASWGLSGSVPLIGAAFFPNLNNTSSGSSIDGMGIWANQTLYEMDVDRNGTPTVTTDDTVVYNNTLFNFSYQTVAPWPTPVAGHSIYWTGNGSVTDGSKWRVSTIGDASNPVTNSQVNYIGTTPVDRGSPGQVPIGGAPPSQLLITEIMYNPGNPDADWEWVEFYNGTASAINLAGYVFDDDDDNSLTSANIASGSIAAGSTGVLYDSALTLAQIEAVWGTGINFIPVTNWTALGNTGDAVALWPSLAAYQAETQSGSQPRRTFNNAIATASYLNNTDGWPDDDGIGSIYLTDLSADLTMGVSWLLSGEGGPVGTGYNSFGGTPQEFVAHPGGDVGSPGSFVVIPEGLPGDYNNDGFVDAADYTVWRNNLGTNFDLNGNGDETGGSAGTVDAADYLHWKNNYGTGGPGSGGLAGLAAVPEPASLALVLLGLAGLSVRRRA